MPANPASKQRSVDISTIVGVHTVTDEKSEYRKRTCIVLDSGGKRYSAEPLEAILKAIEEAKHG